MKVNWTFLLVIGAVMLMAAAPGFCALDTAVSTAIDSAETSAKEVITAVGPKVIAVSVAGLIFVVANKWIRKFAR